MSNFVCFSESPNLKQRKVVTEPRTYLTEYVVKFIHSEFCEISTLLLSVCTVDKSKVEILQNCVAFSDNTNFKVGNNSISCLVAPPRIFRLLMKAKFCVYLPPSTVCNSTVLYGKPLL